MLFSFKYFYGICKELHYEGIVRRITRKATIVDEMRIGIDSKYIELNRWLQNDNEGRVTGVAVMEAADFTWQILAD